MTDAPDRLGPADDRTIAGRAGDGDVAAFAVLVRRYTPMMRAYAHRILNASDEVDDVVQESFVTAWQRLGELDDPGSVKSWLMRITGRKAIDRVRARRPHDDLDDVPEATGDPRTPARIVEMRSEVEALGEALRELPDLQRQCWLLREVGGAAYDEIAEEVGVPASTVRGLLARARRHLMERMEAWR